MNNQEVFDKVARHLLEQKVRSADLEKDNCMYRGPNNLKCAIGCLIPDALYDRRFEGKPVRALGREFIRSITFGGVAIELLTSLQRVHDMVDPSEWQITLTEVAQTFNLNTEVLDEHPRSFQQGSDSLDQAESESS